MNKWYKKCEFAKLRGINPGTVTKMISAGKLETNGEPGHACRVREPESAADINAAKLAKLTTDTELTRQKLRSTIRRQREEVAQMMLDEFRLAFTPFKVRLQDLRLDAAEISRLGEMLDSALAEFDSAVRRRLAEDDDVQ